MLFWFVIKLLFHFKDVINCCGPRLVYIMATLVMNLTRDMYMVD